MRAGDNPRFVVTSLEAPTPQMLYEDLDRARGNCENDIKAVKNDLHSDRTSAPSFLANAMRLLLACAAYVLHHALLRTPGSIPPWPRRNPRPSSSRSSKSPPRSNSTRTGFSSTCPVPCPVRALLHRVTALLYAVPAPVATRRKPRDAPCRAQRLPSPTAPRMQRLDRSRKGQRLAVASPLRGRGARVCGSRSLLLSA